MSNRFLLWTTSSSQYELISRTQTSVSGRRFLISSIISFLHQQLFSLCKNCDIASKGWTRHFFSINTSPSKHSSQYGTSANGGKIRLKCAYYKGTVKRMKKVTYQWDQLCTFTLFDPHLDVNFTASVIMRRFFSMLILYKSVPFPSHLHCTGTVLEQCRYRAVPLSYQVQNRT